MPGHTTIVWSLRVKMRSGSTVTLPVAPSMLVIDVLQRSAVPTGTRRRAIQRVDDARFARNARDDLAPFARLDLGLIHATSLRSGATAVSTSSRSNG